MSGPRAVDAARLRDYVADLFVAAGVAPEAAIVAAGGLVDADLEGLHSHGVMLVEMYLGRLQKRSISTANVATIVSEKAGAVVVDAGAALGHVTGRQCMAIAIDKARAHAAGVVAVRHGFHFGAAGAFAQQAAEAGCVGIAMCNTRPLMPVPGGAERVVGNNPIAIALPTEGDIPIVLDMATSEAAMGKIRMAEKTGAAIPATWAVTARGEPTTDPAAAIAGMLLPASGPKGFGLSFVIDLMCGLLAQGATGDAVKPLYGDQATPYDCSHLFIAIDVAHFGDVAAFRRHTREAAERIRNGARAPGVAALFTPGEPEWRKRQQAGGRVNLEPAVIESLRRLGKERGTSSSFLDEAKE